MKPSELSDIEAYEFLAALFPGGLKDPALIAELCPEGWQASPRFARYGDGYMDFYMGTHWGDCRADLTPAYELIFRRLQTHGADWLYAFPRIHIIDFGQKEAAPYNPSAAVEQQVVQKARAERMRRQLDRDALSTKRKARTGPPPATLRAYQSIFHRFPQGWPPDLYTPA